MKLSNFIPNLLIHLDKWPLFLSFRMLPSMKRNFIYCFCLFLLSCSLHKTPVDPNPQLKTAMSDYLNTDPRSKGKYKYDITSVTFFEEPSYYICEFKVHMTNAIITQIDRKVDTVGAMKVKIDKNFKVISRYY